MADKYILRVTAGPDYDEDTHVEVPVNKSEPIRIKSDKADIELNVRIQNYRGLPKGSPSTSPYFDAEPHAYNQDQYSISLRFTPHKPASAGADDDAGIPGQNLQFGNDFDHPIRDRLPPGFNTAMNIVKWWIDPGLDGDAYADRPHLYGPALSSFNAMNVGPGEFDEAKGGLWVEEGGDEEGAKDREEVGMPATGKARMKWALGAGKKEAWRFEYERTYSFDFFNPYLDFANLALRLPGFHLPIVNYWDGQGLRYVLRNKETDEVYLTILFTLYLKEDVNEDGTLKKGALGRATEQAGGETARGHDDHNEEEVIRQAREKLGPAHGEAQTSADDVD